MANDELIAELLARVERVEQENRQLATQVETLRGRVQQEPADGRDHDSIDDSAQLGRRGLLKRVGGMALGVTAVSAAGQLLNAPSAAAADGQPIVMGTYNQAFNSTAYYSTVTGGAALQVTNSGNGSQSEGIYARSRGIGTHGTGEERAGVIGTCPDPNAFYKINRAGVGGVGTSGVVGVMGVSDTAAGVLGRSAGYYAVHGQSERDNGRGVYGEGLAEGAVGVGGYSARNAGVEGYSEEGFGVAGYGAAYRSSDLVGVGVYGELDRPSQVELVPAAVVGNAHRSIGVEGASTHSDAVVGNSMNARGGVFSGGAAAVRLSPGTGATAPAAGQTGDLYVDSTGRLWYCKQGGNTATWANLA